MFENLMASLDLGELMRRAVKYIVEGIMVAIAAYAIPKKSLNLEEVLLIALTAAAKTASCSIEDTITFEYCSPFIAKLLASVPPLVKIIFSGGALIKFAIWFLDFSSRLLALLPKE